MKIDSNNPSIEKMTPNFKASPLFSRLRFLELNVDSLSDAIIYFQKNTLSVIRKLSELCSGRLSTLNYLKVETTKIKEKIQSLKQSLALRAYSTNCSVLLLRLKYLENRLKVLRDEYENYFGKVEKGAYVAATGVVAAPAVVFVGVKAAVAAGVVKAGVVVQNTASALLWGQALSSPAVMHLASHYKKDEQAQAQARIEGERAEIERDPALHFSKKYLAEFQKNKNFVPNYHFLYLMFDYGKNNLRLIRKKGFLRAKFGEALSGEVRWEEDLKKILDYIIAVFVKNPDKKQAHGHIIKESRLSSFFEGGRGNYEAKTKLVISQIQRAGLKLPEGMRLGVQVFSDYVRPVIIDLKNKENLMIFDILSQKWKRPSAPVYHPLIFAHAYLKGKGINPLVEDKHLLILPEKIGNNSFTKLISTNAVSSFPGANTAFFKKDLTLASIAERKAEIKEDLSVHLSKKYLAKFQKDRGYNPNYRPLFLSMDYYNRNIPLIKKLGLIKAKFNKPLYRASLWQKNLRNILDHVWKIFGKNVIGEQVLSYVRYESRLSAFFEGSGGNCEANTKLLISEIQRAGLKLPKGIILGVQVFADHLQPVIVDLRNKTNSRVFDIMANKWTNYSAPVYHPLIFAHAYLKGKGINSIVTEKQLLILSEKKESKRFYFSSNSNSISKFPDAKVFFSSEDLLPFGNISKPFGKSANLKGLSFDDYLAYMLPAKPLISMISLHDYMRASKKFVKKYGNKNKYDFKVEKFEKGIDYHFYYVYDKKILLIFKNEKDLLAFQGLSSDLEKQEFLTALTWKAFTPQEITFLQNILLEPKILTDGKSIPLSFIPRCQQMLKIMNDFHVNLYFKPFRVKFPWRISPSRLIDLYESSKENLYFLLFIKTLNNQSKNNISRLAGRYFNKRGNTDLKQDHPERNISREKRYFDNVVVSEQKGDSVELTPPLKKSIKVLGCIPGIKLEPGFTCNFGKSATQFKISSATAIKILLYNFHNYGSFATNSSLSKTYPHLKQLFALARTNIKVKKWLEDYWQVRKSALIGRAFIFRHLQLFPPHKDDKIAVFLKMESFFLNDYASEAGKALDSFFSGPSNSKIDKIIQRFGYQNIDLTFMNDRIQWNYFSRPQLKPQRKTLISVMQAIKTYGELWFLHVYDYHKELSYAQEFIREMKKLGLKT